MEPLKKGNWKEFDSNNTSLYIYICFFFFSMDDGLDYFLRQMDPEVGNGCVQEDEELGWGKSLPVPSVQEIVRNDSLCVPERYIQERQNRPDYHSEVSYASSEIPVINMSLLANGDKDELRKFDIACKEWGFFQVHSTDATNCGT